MMTHADEECQNMTMGEKPELRPGRVHEVLAREAGDSAARLFALCVAGDRAGACLWIIGKHSPPPCPHGFHGVTDPNAVLIVQVRTPLDGLWTAEEGLRSGAVRTVIVESEKPVDLLQSRRLQLAAEASGSLGLFLGPDSGNTAAETRWRCSAAPHEDRRLIRFDWEQVKNKKGSNTRLEALRDEATGRVRVVAASGGGAGSEERAGSGPASGHRGRGERRLAALLAEHGGA